MTTQKLHKLNINVVNSVNDTFINQINSLQDVGKTWDLIEGEKFLSYKNNLLLFASINDEPAGFLSAYKLQRFDNRKCEYLLYEIGVKENFRKRGIAKALIEKLKQIAISANASEIWVLTEAANSAAMALYKSVGGSLDNQETKLFTIKL